MVTDADRLNRAFALLEELAPTEIASLDRLSPDSWPSAPNVKRRHLRAVLAASVAAVLVVAGIAFQVRRSPRTQEPAAVARTSSPRATIGPIPPGRIIPVRQREAAEDLTLQGFTVAKSPVLEPTFRLSAMRGKVVVLSYGASWCPPCRQETLALAPSASDNAGRGVVMAGIDVDDLSATAAAQILTLPPAYRFYLDRNRSTAKRLGVSLEALPVTVIIDRHGRVAAVYEEAVTAPTLQTALTKLLQEH